MLHYIDRSDYSYILVEPQRADGNVKSNEEDTQEPSIKQDNTAIIVCMLSYCLQFSSYVFLET